MRQISNHKVPTVTAALDHVFGHTPDGVVEMSVIMKTECIEVNRVGRLWPVAEICICCSGICKETAGFTQRQMGVCGPAATYSRSSV